MSTSPPCTGNKDLWPSMFLSQIALEVLRACLFSIEFLRILNNIAVQVKELKKIKVKILQNCQPDGGSMLWINSWLLPCCLLVRDLCRVYQCMHEYLLEKRKRKRKTYKSLSITHVNQISGKWNFPWYLHLRTFLSSLLLESLELNMSKQTCP